MPYELRMTGRPSLRFDTQQEALEAAGKAVVDDPDASPEVIDLATGHEAAPGADKPSREDLRNKIGF